MRTAKHHRGDQPRQGRADLQGGRLRHRGRPVRDRPPAHRRGQEAPGRGLATLASRRPAAAGPRRRLRRGRHHRQRHRHRHPAHPGRGRRPAPRSGLVPRRLDRRRALRPARRADPGRTRRDGAPVGGPVRLCPPRPRRLRRLRHRLERLDLLLRLDGRRHHLHRRLPRGAAPVARALVGRHRGAGDLRLHPDPRRRHPDRRSHPAGHQPHQGPAAGGAGTRLPAGHRAGPAGAGAGGGGGRPASRR